MGYVVFYSMRHSRIHVRKVHRNCTSWSANQWKWRFGNPWIQWNSNWISKKSYFAIKDGIKHGLTFNELRSLIEGRSQFSDE